jgi:hypothetical protein
MVAMRYEGGCLCGAVRYVAEGPPVNERICHCRLCQKAVGAAFNARLLFPEAAVVIGGAVAVHASSSAVERGFCAACGTTLFSRRHSAGTVAMTAGSLDDPTAFRPTMHIWTASRQPWLRLDDGLPQCEGAAP